MTGRVVAAIAGACLALPVFIAHAQQRGGTAQTDKVSPVNTGANPYRVVRDWAQLVTEARPWGGSNGVAIDRDGRSVWAVDRCSPGTTPGCLGSKANPVHHFGVEAFLQAARTGKMPDASACDLLRYNGEFVSVYSGHVMFKWENNHPEFYCIDLPLETEQDA